MRLAGFSLIATLALAAVACGDGEQSATGVITHVDAASITQVDSFTLRTNEGETLTFSIAAEAAPDPQEGFIASHLRSHAAVADQVEVFYREEGGELLALRLEHAE